METATIAISIAAATALLLPRILKFLKKAETQSRGCAATCTGCAVRKARSGQNHCEGAAE
jgi:hypothetical protein